MCSVAQNCPTFCGSMDLWFIRDKGGWAWSCGALRLRTATARRAFVFSPRRFAPRQSCSECLWGCCGLTYHQRFLLSLWLPPAHQRLGPRVPATISDSRRLLWAALQPKPPLRLPHQARLERRVTGAAAAVSLGTRPAPCRLKARSCVNFWRFGEPWSLVNTEVSVGVCLEFGSGVLCELSGSERFKGWTLPHVGFLTRPYWRIRIGLSSEANCIPIPVMCLPPRPMTDEWICARV